MSFPVCRPRRLRSTGAIRDLVAEYKLNASDLMYPLFVVDGIDVKQEINAMPGQYHWSVDRLDEIINQVLTSGVMSVMVFGIPAYKDPLASDNYDDEGITQRAVKKIKKLAPNLIVATDVCLCSFTPDGHCGMVHDDHIDNDMTLPILQKTAVSHAKAGADIVAPSGMMDGMIGAMRQALDSSGLSEVMIMSYAVKYASGFYGPFREACDSHPTGDRKSYQMDWQNKKEAIKEALMDIEEGADFIMVKPALAYLDIIQDVSSRIYLPVAAYQVSGEYAMIKAAAQNGWIDEKAVVLESLTGIKRAGAKLILSYFALDVAGTWL
ncbi:MAG: porphobilinogen synthase [Francisellaceae bacterium]